MGYYKAEYSTHTAFIIGEIEEENPLELDWTGMNSDIHTILTFDTDDTRALIFDLNLIYIEEPGKWDYRENPKAYVAVSGEVIEYNSLKNMIKDINIKDGYLSDTDDNFRKTSIESIFKFFEDK